MTSRRSDLSSKLLMEAFAHGTDTLAAAIDERELYLSYLCDAGDQLENSLAHQYRSRIEIALSFIDNEIEYIRNRKGIPA